MTLKSIVLAAATVLAVSAGGADDANAHVKRHFFGFHHGPHGQLFIGSGGGGCGYYYDRWQDTGRFYWKRRYYECRGWW